MKCNNRYTVLVSHQGYWGTMYAAAIIHYDLLARTFTIGEMDSEFLGFLRHDLAIPFLKEFAMKLTSNERLQIEVFARRAAMLHYMRRHSHATDRSQTAPGKIEGVQENAISAEIEYAAWRFAGRYWRKREYLQVGIDIVAIFRAMDEAKAAPLN